MGLLPERTAIVGYARSSMTDAAANDKLRGFLKAGTEEQRAAFLALCTYRSGAYDDAVAFGKVSCSYLYIQTRCF
jgi:glucose-6-phosphate 1-dehydrogenase